MPRRPPRTGQRARRRRPWKIRRPDRADPRDCRCDGNRSNALPAPEAGITSVVFGFCLRMSAPVRVWMPRRNPLNPDRTVLVPALEIADFAIAATPRPARLPLCLHPSECRARDRDRPSGNPHRSYGNSRAKTGANTQMLTPTKDAPSRNFCVTLQPFRPAMKRGSVSLASTPPRSSPCQKAMRRPPSPRECRSDRCRRASSRRARCRRSRRRSRPTPARSCTSRKARRSCRAPSPPNPGSRGDEGNRSSPRPRHAAWDCGCCR